MRSVLPILTVIAALLAIWYGSAVWLNAQWTYDQAARAGVEVGLSDIVRDAMVQDRPVLPAPHQVAVELVRHGDRQEDHQQAVAGLSWLDHRQRHPCWASYSAPGWGSLLAIGIVHNRAMDMSVMPWAIASQTIPILAIAPMIIVVLNSIGIQGLVPKAIISAYLSFFPVVVGMVDGAAQSRCDATGSDADL